MRWTRNPKLLLKVAATIWTNQGAYGILAFGSFRPSHGLTNRTRAYARAEVTFLVSAKGRSV